MISVQRKNETSPSIQIQMTFRILTLDRLESLDLLISANESSDTDDINVSHKGIYTN